jgi:hypothetical protein
VLLSPFVDDRLGHLDIVWSDLPVWLRSKLERDIVSCTTSLLTNGEVKEREESCLGPRRLSTPDTALSYLLLACKLLDCRWYEKKSIREAVFRSYCRCFHPDQLFSDSAFLSTLPILGELGVTWNELPADMRSIILQAVVAGLQSSANGIAQLKGYRTIVITLYPLSDDLLFLK